MTRDEAIKILLGMKADNLNLNDLYTRDKYESLAMAIKALEQEPKTGHCKDCKYFEYDSVEKCDGMPLIVAHEICSKWGNGCKTREDGYCFLFEPQESEEVDAIPISVLEDIKSEIKMSYRNPALTFVKGYEVVEMIERIIDKHISGKNVDAE